MSTKKGSFLKQAGAFFLSAVLTLEGLGTGIVAHADTGIPSNFTVDAIRAAGITDENFATAVYDSIAAKIQLNSYNVDPTWTTKEILENFKPANLDGKRAIINAEDKGIKDISGIKLLKNVSEIRLSANDIHDLTLLAIDDSNPDKQIYFNKTSIYIESGNYQNIIPAELIGTRNGNYTVDSTMTFMPVELHYLYGDLPKKVGLDFGVRIHGDEGGIFNAAYSEAESVRFDGVSWEPYADSASRYTGTTISMSGTDGKFTVSANANEDIANGLPSTIHYWSNDEVERTLNVSYRYNFTTEFYRLLTETADVTVLGGIRFRKTDPDGNPVPGAEYTLWSVPTAGSSTRYPDDSASWTTNSDGELVISGLPAGNYELREMTSPDGFLLNPDPVPVTVSPDAESSLFSSVAGGETSAALTSDDAVYTPVWDAVVSADGLSRDHYMTLKSGSVTEKTAAELGGDALLRNGGAGITALKGEKKEGAELREITDDTKITVYAGDDLLGTYSSAADARAAVNELVENSGFTAETGNLRIEAAFVYEDTDPSHYAEASQVDQPEEPEPDEPEPDEPEPDEPEPDEPEPDEPAPVPVEEVKSIEVRKSWSEEGHPLKILVRLLVVLEDGTERVVGKIRELTKSGGWKTVWNFKEITSALTGGSTASDSNASDSSGTATGSNAGNGTGMSTSSNADAYGSALYDEDGELLDGLVLDDLNAGLKVEEVDVPEGWKAEYSDAVLSSDGTAVFEILNRKVDTPETEPETEPENNPESPDEPDTDSSEDDPDDGGSSGGGGGGGGSSPGTESAPAPVPEPETAPEIKQARPSEDPKPGLPYGRIDRKNEKGIPKTGEPGFRLPQGVPAYLGGLLVIITLIAAIFCGCRKE